MIEHDLSLLPLKMTKARIPLAVLSEAKKRVLDTLGCYFGAFNAKPVSILREVMSREVQGYHVIWGTQKRVSPEVAAWCNGTGVRALDYNDTYLSKEPCHPSDIISSLFVAAELSKNRSSGLDLLKAIVLGYDVMCRLCDATSLRTRGWDHVTYLPLASAVACSYLLELTPDETKNAIALSIIGHSAMRQTRVGEISDWKASCASYAARAGLWAARLAKEGFTGPSDIFSGKHGFFHQVSGSFELNLKSFGKRWRILDTHTKFFPAEHHAQSAIEAAVMIGSELRNQDIQKIEIVCFDVAVSIIGSEKEKWIPKTRETADHSMPYLVAAALVEGNVNLYQYESKLFTKKNIQRLMAMTVVKSSKIYTQHYPKKMGTLLRVQTRNKSNGKIEWRESEVLLPRGYSGNPMSWEEVENKFTNLTKGDHSSGLLLRAHQQRKIIEACASLDEIDDMKVFSQLLSE
ncbi:MAG: MmgE/PrpD family protein [Elusimicrobiota bacterium]